MEFVKNLEKEAKMGLVALLVSGFAMFGAVKSCGVVKEVNKELGNNSAYRKVVKLGDAESYLKGARLNLIYEPSYTTMDYNHALKMHTPNYIFC